MEETLLRPGVVKTADRRLKPKPLRANHWLYNAITSLRWQSARPARLPTDAARGEIPLACISRTYEGRVQHIAQPNAL